MNVNLVAATTKMDCSHYPTHNQKAILELLREINSLRRLYLRTARPKRHDSWVAGAEVLRSPGAGDLILGALPGLRSTSAPATHAENALAAQRANSIGAAF